MAIKKTELYSSLWSACDELRGKMDASQYKDYVLTLLFVKYVSDKYSNNPNGTIIIPDGGSFEDMIKLNGNKEIGDKINKIISKLAEANDLKGVIDVADFNDENKLGKGKDMVDLLSNLVKIFDGFDLGANRADGDDLLGDAYEYLMRNFATESGKSKGQFYTPAEVSRVLAKVVGIKKETSQDATIYDPTCGSGSLLLKASDEAERGLSIYGQEMDNATYSLAKMNMILHSCVTAELFNQNTLSSPCWKDPEGNLKTFDFAVANPPFSNKSWTNGLNLTNDEFNRFEFGTPPSKNGDYAFLLHILKSLKSTGKAAIILPHGVLFRGNVEGDIRKNLVRQGYIKGIIGLPANLFYGTGIPACIIVIDKENSSNRDNIFMIDASKGFMKDGNKNRLRSQDIHKIVDTFNKQLEIERYSRLVSFSEIEKNDFNLNIPRYIDSSEPEDLHDIFAHLNGGIPKTDIDNLEEYWQVFPNLRNCLFTNPQNESYVNSLIESNEVKSTILNNSEFKEFASRTLLIYTNWKNEHLNKLNSLKTGIDPKALINDLSESLLSLFAKTKLINNYDIYQILMDYWADTMQDDVYLISQENWEFAKTLRELVEEKGKKLKETPDLIYNKKKYKSDLIPPSLIINRYFSSDKEKLEDLINNKDVISQDLESLVEENNGDDGIFSDLEKINKNTVSSLLKDKKNNSDERDILKKYLKMSEDIYTLESKIKAVQKELDDKIFSKYPQLTETEIKEIIINDKWFTTLENSINAEIERVTQQLANRVKLLEERYENPLPKLIDEVSLFSNKVDEHLKKMGLTW